MAIAKDVVKVKFTGKFSKINAPKTLKEQLINIIAEKVKDDEDETNLDSMLDLYEPVLKGAASEIDKIRTEVKKPVTTTEVETEQEEVMQPLPADTPAHIVQMMKMMQATQNELKQLRAEKQTESLSEKFLKDPRVKDIPSFVLKGYIPSSEAELESNIEAITGEYTKFAQANKIAAVGSDAPAGAGGAGGTTTVNEKAVEASIKDWGAAKVASSTPKETVKTV